MKTHAPWLYLGFTLLIAIGFLAVLAPSQPPEAGDSPAVTYTQGILHTKIPYRTKRAGRGKLTVELLDPDDRTVGRTEQPAVAAAGGGAWQPAIKLAERLGVEDLAWHRLRYRFVYDSGGASIEDTESVSQILRMPVVHIFAQQSYMAGGQAAVRVIVTDTSDQVIPGSSTVRVELKREGQKARVLFTGNLNARGTAEAEFRFPAELTGTYPLRYIADTPIGSAEFTQQVRLEDKVSILLTTEKPIYQPGQTIHVRALSLDRANHAAAAARDLTFEVEDSRGNKVFRKATRTDAFGISSAEFVLAGEVNLGTYHLRALMSNNTAEMALRVERYVLPKFKVAIDFAGKDQRARRGYRPGDHVTGTVRAHYFFGKAVDRAEVSLKASGMDVAQFEAVSTRGKTDADGAYRFDFQLPAYFAARPANHGAAAVLVEAGVKDAAGHTETRGEPITVSESALMVTAVPEGGNLIPNLENQVFVLASYPDGKPAVATIKVHVDGSPDQSVTTDEGGVGVVRLHPRDTFEDLNYTASDREGNHTAGTVKLERRSGQEQILLRTDRAIYRAGDRLSLRVFSTKTKGAAYIDVVKDGQTVLTRDLEIVNGQSEMALVVTPDLAGTVDISAYVFGSNAQPVGDHRLVFVQPAGELKIEAKADAASYKPGEEARVSFRVTDARGEGVQAALGLQVVDEAVFALAEKQPGFAKVFFYLEQEAMKPRYEIHSLSMPEIVEPAAAAAEVPRRERAARALFAATEMVQTNRFDTEFGRTIPVTKFADSMARYRTRFDAQIHRLAECFTRAYSRRGGDLTRVAGQLARENTPELRDAWSNGLHIEQAEWSPDGSYYAARSAGPDKQFGTTDDLTAYLHTRGPRSAGPADSGPSRIDTEIEHDRGPFNGMAEIAGSVLDRQGGAVEGARVQAVSGGSTRTASADAEGRFRMAGLPPGDYEIKVSSGADSSIRRLTLRARDRAVIRTRLSSEVAGTVEVVTAFPHIRRKMMMLAEDRAFAPPAAGVAVGGVIGGAIRVEALAQAVPAAPANMATKVAVNSAVLAREPAAPAVHVRSYFPEALYINPRILTDRNGAATITIPLADSITTWRMAMLASTTQGTLGSAVSSLKVFQDFFVDLDLPVTLTQGDRVSIPVAVYNYSAARGDVRLDLQPAEWFALVNDSAAKTVAVESGSVGASQYAVEARRIGKFKLTLSAKMAGGSNPADIVVREIEVVPNGREQTEVFNGRLETTAQHDLKFPPAAIAEASKIFVRLYPGPLSQIVEGMDAILRMPFGCFEQTSSATYPNVLALDYMKRIKKLTPEVHAKAEGFIANGYQRLLTFEVPGGGFSWFGNAPANKILTSYGLMEFSDMSRVHDVDPRLIERTQQWLAAQQDQDGSWKPDTQFINEGATNRFNSGALRITSYIAWSLQNTGFRGAAVEKAKAYVAQHMNANADSYTLAVLANFAVEYRKDREFTRQAMRLLLDAHKEKDEQAWWTADETGVFATGESATVETTGLAVQALLKWGEASATAVKALKYIAGKKDAQGTWGTTQATIMALRALLLSTEKGAADVRGDIEVSLDGRIVKQLGLTADNNDLFHQFVFPVDAGATHQVSLRFAGKGGLAYQVVGRFFVPWDEKPAQEALSIDVAYDRTHLAQDDIAAATAVIRNNLRKTANMVMVDLGIPPGFDLLTEDLQSYQEKSAQRKSGRLEKFNLTATQAILYFDSIAGGDTVRLQFRLRAKYPIRARTFQSRVYEYYNPAVSATTRPVLLEVVRR